MSRYHRARQAIKDPLQKQLKVGALEKGRQDTPELDKDLSEVSDDLIETFERLVNLRGSNSFWRGIWQSMWGSVMFVAIVALLAVTVSVLDYGLDQNPLKIVRDLFGHKTQVTPSAVNQHPASSPP